MNERPAASTLPRLPLAARLLVRSVAWLPLLCLLLSAGVYFAHLGTLIRANLAPIAAAETGRQIHHEVRLGKATFGPGTITLYNLAVSNRDTFAHSHGEAVARAARVTVHYSLHELIFGAPIRSIGDIVLDSPVVLVERLSNKLYNFSDLLTPRHKKPGPSFIGQIIVHNGTATLRDYVAPARLRERPAINTIYAVNTTVSFHSERYAYFDGTAQGRSERVADIAVRGDASRKTSGRYRVFAHVSDGDARYWSDYFKAFPQGRLLAGRANLDLTVAQLDKPKQPNAMLDLLGRVNFRNVSIALTDPRVSKLPLQRIAGTAIFTGAGVTVDGGGYAAGQPVTVHGSVFDLQKPQLAFNASSPNFDPTPLVRDLPRIKLLPGITLSKGMSATAQITGLSSSPVVSANAILPGISYRGNTAHDIRARILYANNVLSLPQVQFAIAGGQGALRATINTDAPVATVLLGGRVAGVHLASLHLPLTAAGARPVTVGGFADAAFLSTQGQNGGKSPLTVTANVFVSRPSVAQTTLRTLRGRVSWIQGQDVVVRRAVAEDGHGGVAVASGRVPLTPQSHWNLNVDVAGASLASLAAPYAKVPVAGLAYAQAHIGGLLSTPQVVGTGQLYAARFNHIGIDAVTGSIAVGRDSIILNDVALRRYPTEAKVSGTVTQLASGNPALALKVTVAQGDVQDFLALAQEVRPAPRGAVPPVLPTLTGTAQGTFRVSGRVQSPQIAGRAAVTDATIDAYRFNKIRADMAFKNGTLRVENGLVLGENGATATARGEYHSRTGRIAAAVQGENISVDLFRQLFNPYADLDGILNFSVTLAGTVQSPSGALSVSGRNLAVNGQSVAPLTIAGRYADGVFEKTLAPWTLALQPPLTDSEGQPISPPPGQVDYVIDALRLTLPTPAHPARPRSVQMAAHIPAEAPEHISHLLDTLRGSLFANNPAVAKLLTTVDALPAPLEGTLYVPALTVTGPLDAPRIAGTLDARDFVVNTENGVGQAQIAASYVGGAKPQAQASVTVTNLRAGGVPIQTIAADGSLENRVVTLRTLDAHNAEADVHAAGRADLDGQISATLDASNVPLSLFNVLIPVGADGKVRKLSGTLSALTVEASGRTAQPDLIGSVNVSKPTLDLDSAGSSASRYALDTIRTGAVTLTSAGATRLLTVNDLAAFKGGRPVATLSGTLPLNLTSTAGLLALANATPLHAELKIADLSVLTLLSPSLIDPARTGGTLTASADVGTGAQSRRARVDLVNGSVGLTGFDTSLSKVSGSILFSGDNITVRGLTGVSSKGGTISVLGGGTLSRANLRVRADGLTLDETGKGTFLAQAFNSGARGRLDGLVTLAGPWLSPRVATLPGAPLIVSGASGTLPSVTPPAGRIARIVIERAGPGTVPTPRILAAVSQKVGDAFDATAAQRDLVSIRNLGYFSGGVKLSTARDSSGGIVVTYTVAESAVQTFDPQFDVAVALGGTKNETVTVSSSLLKAQARGDVHLGGTLLSPTLQAHLSIARGSFILPPSTLLRVVKPGEGGENIVDARYPVSDPEASDQPGLETRVDLTAQANVTVSPALLAANVSAASPGVEIAPSVGQVPTIGTGSTSGFGSGAQSQRYTITAHAIGLLNVPNRLTLELTSSPPGLTRQDMLAALVQEDAYLNIARGGGGAENAVKTQLGAAFSTIALPTLLSPLEESIASTFGLEDFSVDYAPDAPVQVTLSKLIAPRITATYSRGFGPRTAGANNFGVVPPQYTLKLGYGFTNHFQFSISTDDQRNNTAALEGVYSF